MRPDKLAYLLDGPLITGDHIAQWKACDITSLVIGYRAEKKEWAEQHAAVVREHEFEVFLVELSEAEWKECRKDQTAVERTFEAKREQWSTLPSIEPEPWPVLQPLPDAMPAAPTLTRDMLPPDLSGWVFDIAHRMQCAVDYPAVAAMVALATVVGRKVTIRPKEHDNWYVVPNLWAQIIGPPGVLKSPAVHAAFAPLYKMAADAREAAKQAIPAYEAALAEYTLQQESLKRQMKSAVDKGEPTAGLKEQLAALKKPEEPSEHRFLTNDSTIEKLGLLLVKNTNGLLIERDELSGLFAQMEMKGHEQDRAFYLEAWDGRQSKSIDRVGSGSIWVEHCLLSMIGTIQPGPLAAYLDRFYGEGQTDGFIERFQLSVFPAVPAWSKVDQAPDRKAAARAHTLFTRMAALLDEHQLSFDPEAQEVFWAWLDQLEALVRDEGLHPILRSHLSKYRSLMPSLALLFQLALSPVLTAVGVEATEMAVRWCAFLETHARRTLWPVIQTEKVSTVLKLARRLRGLVGEEFTARDLTKNDWSGLKESSVVEEALRELERLGWVRGAQISFGRGGGRKTTRWTVNPAITAGIGGGGSRELGVTVSSQQQIPTSSSSRKEDSSDTDTTNADNDQSSLLAELEDSAF